MHQATIQIVVLWEHELIAAAKALEQAHQPNATTDDLNNAFKACWAALYSKEMVSGGSAITIMKAGDIPKP